MLDDTKAAASNGREPTGDAAGSGGAEASSDDAEAVAHEETIEPAGAKARDDRSPSSGEIAGSKPADAPLSEGLSPPRSERLTWRDGREWLAILLSGAATGWLLGLTLLPLAESLITSLLAIVLGAASILAGLQAPQGAARAEKGVRIRPEAVAALSVGLALGASLGTVARTHDWLGAPPRGTSDRELQASLGVLYNGLDASTCVRLTAARDDDARLPNVARAALPRAARQAWAVATNDFTDLDELRRLVDECQAHVAR